RGKRVVKGSRMTSRVWRPIIEPSLSSPDEFPRQRSPACTFDSCFDLTEGQLLRRASVKRKPCGSPTKNGCANLTPLRLCRYFTDNDAGLVSSYIVQRNM